MNLNQLPPNDALLIVRALGLLFTQAGVYGANHKVTQSAATTVFKELSQVVEQYKTVEIAMHENSMLVNGCANGIDAISGRNLNDKMKLFDIGGLTFLHPLNYRDFFFCVQLVSTPVNQLASKGGAEKILQDANLQTIKTLKSHYQRVRNSVTPESKTPAPAVPAAATPAAGGGVIDLSAAFSHVAASTPGEAEVTSDSAFQNQKAAEMANMLREAATLLDQGFVSMDATDKKRFRQILLKVRHILDQTTAQSELEIATFADQVDEDRQTIASIESAARRRGIGLKLTRGELIERYAELNQEIVQPLSVSTGVIDMLAAGKGGSLTTAQQDMLKLASESVERVNQLIAYMHRIAGLPTTYTPDTELIKSTYNGQNSVNHKNP